MNVNRNIPSKGNPALSNVKFIFYQYDIEGIQDQLELIDTVLRDIEYEKPEEEPHVPSCNVVQPVVPEKVDSEEKEHTLPIAPKRDFILSVPYKVSPAVVSQTIRTAAAIYCQQHQDENRKCSHCDSVEVIQRDQLGQLSEWRKRTMQKISPLSKHSVLNRRRALQK